MSPLSFLYSTPREVEVNNSCNLCHSECLQKTGVLTCHGPVSICSMTNLLAKLFQLLSLYLLLSFLLPCLLLLPFLLHLLLLLRGPTSVLSVLMSWMVLTASLVVLTVSPEMETP